MPIVVCRTLWLVFVLCVCIPLPLSLSLCLYLPFTHLRLPSGTVNCRSICKCQAHSQNAALFNFNCALHWNQFNFLLNANHWHRLPTHTHRHTTNTHTQTRSAAAVSVCIVGDPEVVHEGGGLETETESKNKQSSGYERLFQNSFVILWQANENFPNYVQAKRGSRDVGGKGRGSEQQPKATTFCAQIRFELSFSSLSLSFCFTSASFMKFCKCRWGFSTTLIHLPLALLPPSRSFVRDVNLMKKSTPSRQSYHSLSLSLSLSLTSYCQSAIPMRSQSTSSRSRSRVGVTLVDTFRTAGRTWHNITVKGKSSISFDLFWVGKREDPMSFFLGGEAHRIQFLFGNHQMPPCFAGVTMWLRVFGCVCACWQ